jgi:antitoxin (DNA-binding transcriptional repressor) of toxin-antitoxin stability system
MRTVNIAELRSQLTEYLTYAQAGETVLIRDHDIALAQLIPAGSADQGLSGDLTEEELELVAAGLMRPRKRSLDIEKLRNMPKEFLLPENSGIKAVLDERNEGL